MTRHSPMKLDLTGQRFGKLLVLDPAKNIGSKTAWRCRCDCMQEVVVKTCNLRSGRTKSCGCLYGLSPQPEGRLYPAGVVGRASLTYIDGTCVEMLQANTVRSNNTSGVPGVEWRKNRNSWRATICFKGKRHYLGCFKKFDDAVRARKQAEERLFGTFLREVRSSTDSKAE